MYFSRLVQPFLESSAWFQNQEPIGRHEEGILKEPLRWDNVVPSKHFEWYPCFNDFQCARLQVPMDWHHNSAEASKTVELAIIKVEATVPVTDPTYGGAVVLNPGGPGGSGVSQILHGGHHIRTVLSAGPDAENETARNFDIIGVDPRGINNTRPLLAGFPNHLEAAVYQIEADAHGYIGSSDTSFDYLWASERALAAGCSERGAKEGIAKHMSTAPVARDIIEIFERHGEWREREAHRLLSEGDTIAPSEKQAALARTAYQRGKEMVQYWGFSYGSILGATLSTMFPDRIKRAVLDGVSDSHDYMAGGWTTNLRDTDRLLAKFAEHCYEGGQQHCPIWHKGGPALIAENVQRIIAELRHHPLSLPGDSLIGPATVTYNDVKRLIRSIVYWPLNGFPELAQVLHELSQGNGTTLALWAQGQRPTLGEALSPDCQEDGPYSPACLHWEGDQTAGYGITCSDGSGDRLNQTKEEYRTYASRIISQSSLLGESWAAVQLPCTAWHARPHWRYDGNFHNTTAHPILFVGNTIDPVTPLFNAFKMADGFLSANGEGAGVLQLDVEGHCTYSGISLCSGRAIREYFQSGTLPGEVGGLAERHGWQGRGALCGADRTPFDGYAPNGPIPDLPEGETDEGLWHALVGLNRAWR